MELDDLRRQWQQSGQAPPPRVDVALLLSRRSTNLVEKIRRNALLEISLSVLLVVWIPFLPMSPSLGLPLPLLNALRVLLVLLMLVMVYYFYRKLKLLRRMVQPEAQVREHLVALCAGLRQMLRFYYRLSLLIFPAILALMIGFQVGRELAQKAAHHWNKLSLFAGVMLVLGALLQALLIYATRWWLQRLYGQHLDRLEGQLRELAEPSESSAT